MSSPDDSERFPEISVIIPAYNAENTIKRAINSCLSLKHLSLEVIIVDDGSTDKTLEKIGEFSTDARVKTHSLKKNSGVSYARNFGIKLTKSEHIIFLDSDDYYLPEAGDIISNALTAYPDLELYCFGYLINGRPSLPPKDYPLHMEFMREKFSNTNTIVCKRSLFSKVEFSISHRIGEDTLLWFTLLCGHTARYFPGNIAFYDYKPKVNAVRQHPILGIDLSSLGLPESEQTELRALVEKDLNMRLAFARMDSLLQAYHKLGVRGIIFWVIGPKFFPIAWKMKRAFAK